MTVNINAKGYSYSTSFSHLSLWHHQLNPFPQILLLAGVCIWASWGL